jgi:hypothetical protein
MKRSVLVLTALVLSLSHSVSRADFDDLPDPGGDAGNTTPTQPPAPGEPTPGQAQYAGSLNIGGISRRTGGTIYTIRLYKSLPLIRLDLRVTANKAKFHSVIMVTDNGERIEETSLRDTAVMEAGSLVSSEALDNTKKIASIELVAESFGAEADIMVTAVSNVEIPKLLLKVEPPKPAPSPSPTPEPTPVPGPTPNPTPLPQPTPQVPGEVGNIKIGDTVLVNSNAVGTVAQIFANGKVIVTGANGERIPTEITFIEKSTRCVDNFCVGQKVEYNGGKAQIINLFASGWVYLSTQNGRREIVDLFFISEADNCDSRNEFCVGDTVLYQNRNDAVITAIRSNDEITVRVLATGALVPAQRKDLAASIRCTQGDFRVCVGDRVTVQGSGAEILGVYSNGTAKVRMDNSNRVIFVSQKSLSKKITCMKDICVGQKARYGAQQALVKEIYSNGTARVVIGILGKEYLVRVDSLRPW